MLEIMSTNLYSISLPRTLQLNKRVSTFSVFLHNIANPVKPLGPYLSLTSIEITYLSSSAMNSLISDSVYLLVVKLN